MIHFKHVNITILNILVPIVNIFNVVVDRYKLRRFVCIHINMYKKKLKITVTMKFLRIIYVLRTGVKETICVIKITDKS